MSSGSSWLPWKMPKLSLRCLQWILALVWLHSAADISLASPATNTQTGDAPKSKSAARQINSVPYPGGALYFERGLSGAFLGGKYQNFGEATSLFQWQGELGYFYTPWFSGGLGFRIRAGEPDSAIQKILNRYYLLVRFHKSFGKVAVYIGPQIGVDNINNVLSLHKLNKDSVIKSTDANFRLDIGGGWRASRMIGATLGTNIEYNFIGEDSLAKNNSLNIHFNPGIALNLLFMAPSLQELVPALYLNVEGQIGFLLLEKNRRRHDQSIIMGIGIGF